MSTVGADRMRANSPVRDASQPNAQGLRIEARFCPPGGDPFATVEWDKRSAAIKDENGEVLFEQHDCEIPATWSSLATNVVVSKYFYGEVGTDQRERSVRDLIHRVSRTIADWGIEDGYFATAEDGERFYRELTWLCLHQHGAFNSPVWFNVGLYHQYGVQGARCNWHWDPSQGKAVQPENPYQFPQASACFIQSVGDNMEDIMRLATSEAMLFKFGSGTGTDLSTIRSQREKLSGGGRPSGPLSFMRVYDQIAAVVKCVTADTYIYTADGIRTIGQVVGPDAPEGFSPAERLEVATPDGRRRASQVYVGKPSPVRRMTLRRTGLELTGTEEHPVLVMTEDGSLRWKPLCAVRRGDRVAVDRGNGLWSRQAPPLDRYLPACRAPRPGHPAAGLPTELTAPLARALGYLVAAGRVQGQAVRLEHADRRVVQEGLESLRRAIGEAGDPAALQTRLDCATGRVAWTGSLDCPGAAAWLEALGGLDRAWHRRQMPQVVLDSPESLMTEFLRGCFAALGQADRRLQLVSPSGELARQMQVVLLNYGIVSRRRRVPGTRQWQVEPLGGEARSLATRIGFPPHTEMAGPAGSLDADGGIPFRGTGHRRERGSQPGPRAASQSAAVALAEPQPIEARAYLAMRQFFWDEVQEIVEAGTAVTYDLTVPGNHAFLTNGIVSHNSGGKTRRAAKMQSLKVGHPDILEFIECKHKEEQKAKTLIEKGGYEANFNGEAYSSILFQNANLSVRVTDEFMQAVQRNSKWMTHWITDPKREGPTYDARFLLQRMAECAWHCGDPGVQYDSTINRWHTCPESGRINASNPCVTGDTLVATDEGLQPIASLVGRTPSVVGLDGRLHRAVRVVPTGTRPVYRLRTECGYQVKLTVDHRVWTAGRGDVPAGELAAGDQVRLWASPAGDRSLDWEAAEGLGRMLQAGSLEEGRRAFLRGVGLEAQGRGGPQGCDRWQPGGREDAHDSAVAVCAPPAAPEDLLETYVDLSGGWGARKLGPLALRLDRAGVSGLLAGLFGAASERADGGRELECPSAELLSQVQLLLLHFGVQGHLVAEEASGGQAPTSGSAWSPSRLAVDCVAWRRLADALTPSGDRGEALPPGPAAEPGPLVDRVAAVEYLGEQPVYDLTEPETSHFVANGVAVHNCSEYMFLDDTACNLASINLMKFAGEDGTFDVERFQSACRIFFIAQEILVDHASYPTEPIAVNSHRFRPLGLGYSNLGSLLMSSGLPYDSDAALGVCGAITAILHGAANLTSAELARAVGPFEAYAENRQPMLAVMQMHRDAVDAINPAGPEYLREAAERLWDEVLRQGRKYGFRNAQATVLAPTGTISFMMDCDTTGIEPDIALVKYKQLAGGGMLKIVNQTVRRALQTLGYDAGRIESICRYIDEHDTIEGAPELAQEHLPVFDCAFKPAGGVRSIPWRAHVRMMAAAQPFLSGAISKTVNMPADTTPQDIADAYLWGWELGLKALAIYRDGSKQSQPLSTTSESSRREKQLAARPRRERLPDTRRSITHKFSVAGHEGYITVGLYDDGRPGELFITMAKEGSTVGGLMDSFGTAISMSLQYGVPLEVLVNKFSHTRFEPMGHTTNPDVRIAKSVVDYIFRWMGITFLPGYREASRGEPLPAPEGADAKGGADVRPGDPPAGGSQPVEAASNGASPAKGSVDKREELLDRAGVAMKRGPNGSLEARDQQFARFQSDAPSCDNCGAITVRNGNCYLCHNCGNSMGCS